MSAGVLLKQINYTASKTASKFHASNKIVRGFLGPVGNGKSVACIQEILRCAADQWPNVDGIRKTRWAIVRNTYPELRTTTLNTWKAWIPEFICPITLSPIIIAKMNQPLSDGTMMEFEVYFLSLDSDDDVKKLLGLEVTGVFLNEARELSYAVLDAARERIGRYPSVIEGYEDTKTYKAPRDENGNYKPCKRKLILMDTNPPDTDHWWYQLAEEGCLRTVDPMHKEFAKDEVARVFDFFRGPPPLIKELNGSYTPNPLAENIQNLPGGYGYYLDMIAGKLEDHINVMVLGNYGFLKTGKPVYSEYNDRLHCPETGIIPINGLPIALGWDFGLQPSCIIGQLTSLGQLIILDELCANDTNVRAFAQNVVKPLLSRKYSGYEIEFSYADPAGGNRGEGEGKSAIRILNDDYVEQNEFGDIITPLNMGFITEEAPTNDPTLRLDAVKSFLTRLVDGGLPAYVLNKDCKLLRKGKMGGYRYKKLQIRGDTRYNERPDKNEYSHCFIGSTPVLTSRGYIQIKDLKIGDKMSTPIGYREVTHLMNRISSELIELTFNNGKTIISTIDHPFYTHRGKIRADDLQYSDVFYSEGELPEWADHLNTKYKNLTALSFTESQQGITNRIVNLMKALFICTVMFGRTVMEVSKAATIFITKTTTNQTTQLKILSVLHKAITPLYMAKNGTMTILLSQKYLWTKQEQRLLFGMEALTVSNSIVSLQNKHGKEQPKKQLSAHGVQRNIKATQNIQEKDSVLCHVKAWLENTAALMTKLESVSFVKQHSKQTSIKKRKPALKVVAIKLLTEQKKVYDITVFEAHCFYANGVLVSNCADAEQYLALGYTRGRNVSSQQHYGYENKHRREVGAGGY